MDKRVRATKHGQWQGRPFRPGDVAVMPAAIAKVYADMQQVEILGDAPSETPVMAAKTAVERPGPPVETAAKPAAQHRGARRPGKRHEA